jgi:hypothetical protein
MGSLLSRLEDTEPSALSFVPTAQRDLADTALRVAHNTLLEVLEVQQEHFKIPGLEKQIETCFQDFLDIHRKKS